MIRAAPSQPVAIGLGILITVLWSTSWILIKVGLAEEDLPPIGFAGLRYGLAAIILLAVASPRLVRVRAWRAGRGTLVAVAIYGAVHFGLEMAAQFVALEQLPAATVSLFISTAPAIAAVLAVRLRHEAPTPGQAIGIVILIVGVIVFFGLELPSAGSLPGVAAALVVALSIAGSARLGRTLAIDSPRAFGGVLGLTAIAMGVGAVATLAVAFVVEGIPSLSPTAWLIIGWLAVVNTAFAFTLWTHTMRTLTAVESTALANLMVVQIAVLAWLLLGEALDMLALVGLALALAGVSIVQLVPFYARRRRTADVPEGPEML